MERRKFGNTDLEVSAISLGCWIFGVDWWGHRTQEDCNRMCGYSLDQGITYFDNGDAYGNGRSEELFGRWMKDAKIDRSKVEIGGKVGYDFYSDPGEQGSHRERKQDFSPKFMRFSLEQALTRLGTDYIDLYMTHNIKLPQFRDDTFAEMEKFKDEGKIRVWGVSLGPASGGREEGVKAMMDHGAMAGQTVLALFAQAPGLASTQVAQASGAGVLARLHDNSRILMDRVKLEEEIGGSDHRKFRDNAWKVYGLKKLDLVRKYAANHGMSMHTFACKWLLMHKTVTAITGTFLSETEIREAVEATEKPNLTPAEMEELAFDYARDWGLGDEAHPCDLKSSVDPSGKVRSGYIPPPV